MKAFERITLGFLASFLAGQTLSVLIGNDLKILPGTIVTAGSLLVFALLFAVALFWVFRPEKDFGSFFLNVLTVSIAVVFTNFAWLKLLGLHMNTSIVFDDMPAGAMSGYYLMDYFFGRAPGLKIIIAGLQLSGAVLLVFRRTRLIGTLLLLPVSANIALMDIFFEIGISITILATTLTFGLIYLLWTDREKLRILFWSDGRKMTGSLSGKIIGPALLLLPPVLLMSFRSSFENGRLIGKYEAVETSADQKNLPDAVFFDENDDVIFRFGRYDKMRIGHLEFDTKTHSGRIKWRFPKRLSGIEKVAIDPVSADVIRFRSDSLELKLRKTKLPTPE